jgi:RNA polymerase sigma-70 factor (ECF subfamily)
MQRTDARVTPEVIQEAKAGSKRAFGMIVDQYQVFAYRVAFRLLGKTQEAEDIVQESFISLWKNFDRYRIEIKLTTWLYRIIVNRCLDYFKSTSVKQNKNRVDITQAHTMADSNTPERELQNKELMNAILEATESLTPKQRTVFVLRDLEGLEVDEVCSILSISTGNLKSNLYYARLAMSEKLKSFKQPEQRIYEV